MDVKQKILSKELRFKDEFGNNYPDWEEKKLGDIGETFNGLTGKTKKDFGVGKPFIQYMQIFNSAKIDTSKFGYVDINEGEKQKIAKYGDVFFTTSSETPSEIGYASVLTEDVDEVYLNSFCFGYRPYSLNELYPNFSSYLFRSKPLRKQIIKLAQGSTRYNMSKVQLMKALIQLPSLNEQKKIASFLSSVDKKLQQLTKKKSLLEAYKKGIMQKIFSQALRFKDEFGNNYPDWEEKKLGDCIVNNKKSQIQVNEVSENDRNKINQFPFFTSGERLFYSKEYLIENENIFMSTGGRATVKYYNGQCSYSTDTYSFTTNNQYSVGFIFFYLQNIIKKIDTQYFYGSGLKHLDKKGIVKYKLSVPTLNEQQKIANFLSSIDKKIELVSTQIENTKVFKKGLLQQIFV